MESYRTLDVRRDDIVEEGDISGILDIELRLKLDRLRISSAISAPYCSANSLYIQKG